MSAYTNDKPLLRELGLDEKWEGEPGTGPGLASMRSTNGYVDLGTVTVEEAEPDGEYGPRPATTIKVEVSAMPAQFYRFTVTRPRSDSEWVEVGGERKLITNYEPMETLVIGTGSGTFSEYWPMAANVAQRCFEVDRYADDQQIGALVEALSTRIKNCVEDSGDTLSVLSGIEHLAEIALTAKDHDG